MADQVVLRLSKATFAKDCSYFIAVQFGSGHAVQKFRTEVSEPSSSPAFARNTFVLDVPAGVAALALGGSATCVFYENYVALGLFWLVGFGLAAQKSLEVTGALEEDE